MDKTFRVSCSWEVYGTMYIEAKTLEEAIKKAEDESLPTDTDYIDDSFRIDEYCSKAFKEEDHPDKFNDHIKRMQND